MDKIISRDFINQKTEKIAHHRIEDLSASYFSQFFFSFQCLHIDASLKNLFRTFINGELNEPV